MIVLYKSIFYDNGISDTEFSFIVLEDDLIRIEIFSFGLSKPSFFSGVYHGFYRSWFLCITICSKTAVVVLLL